MEDIYQEGLTDAWQTPTRNKQLAREWLKRFDLHSVTNVYNRIYHRESKRLQEPRQRSGGHIPL